MSSQCDCQLDVILSSNLNYLPRSCSPLVELRFKSLKAVVPSVVLKSCLDEMVDKYSTGDQFAEDSDDDDGKSSKKKQTAAKKSVDHSDEYAGSLHLKEGRNVNNNLYYVDHTKLSNEGNGFLPEVRNELLCNAQKSKAELEQLNDQFKSIATEAAKLEAEPKNEELILELAYQEKNLLELNDKLVESRAHASSKSIIITSIWFKCLFSVFHFRQLVSFCADEKTVKKVKCEIDNMSAVWRKRKRQCIEVSSLSMCYDVNILTFSHLFGTNQCVVYLNDGRVDGGYD